LARLSVWGSTPFSCEAYSIDLDANAAVGRFGPFAYIKITPGPFGSRKAGKSFRAVDKQSLDLLQSYPWPGNIRELQNVIERSVIVSDYLKISVENCVRNGRQTTQV